jgi:hypothetical protein
MKSFVEGSKAFGKQTATIRQIYLHSRRAAPYRSFELDRVGFGQPVSSESPSSRDETEHEKCH